MCVCGYWIIIKLAQENDDAVLHFLPQSDSSVDCVALMSSVVQQTMHWNMKSPDGRLVSDDDYRLHRRSSIYSLDSSVSTGKKHGNRNFFHYYLNIRYTVLYISFFLRRLEKTGCFIPCLPSSTYKKSTTTTNITTTTTVIIISSSSPRQAARVHNVSTWLVDRVVLCCCCCCLAFFPGQQRRPTTMAPSVVAYCLYFDLFFRSSLFFCPIINSR